MHFKDNTSTYRIRKKHSMYKILLEKVWSYMFGINGLVISLYFSMSTVSYWFVEKEYYSIKYLVRDFVIVFMFSLLIFPCIIYKIRNLNLNGLYDAKDKNGRSLNVLQIIVFFCTCIVLFIYFLAFNPGGFSGDSITQYRQAITNTYNNWHPALHTLMFFKLPLLITGMTSSIMIFQCLMFSAVVAYVIKSLARYLDIRVTIFYYILIILNPITGNMLCSAFKDNAFAMGCMLLMIYVLNIFFSAGEWIQHRINRISVATIFAFTTLMRHNAILFTLPILLIVLLYGGRKNGLRIIAIGVVLILFVNVPLYAVLNVQKPDARALESLGVPLSIIGGVTRYDPDSLDDKTKEFVYELYSEEEWNRYYNYSGFNSIKFSEVSDVGHIAEVVEKAGVRQIIHYMVKCIIHSPDISLKSLIKLTDPLYSLQEASPFYIVPSITPNEFNIKYDGISQLKEFLIKYQNIVVFLFPLLFLNLGFIHFLIISVSCSRLDFHLKESRKKVFFALPTLLYNFGTMLLLTGSYDCARFFYYTFFVAPIILAIICYDDFCGNQAEPI